MVLSRHRSRMDAITKQLRTKSFTQRLSGPDEAAWQEISAIPKEERTFEQHRHWFFLLLKRHPPADGFQHGLAERLLKAKRRMEGLPT